jgi:hypothetical protein
MFSFDYPSAFLADSRTALDPAGVSGFVSTPGARRHFEQAHPDSTGARHYETRRFHVYNLLHRPVDFGSIRTPSHHSLLLVDEAGESALLLHAINITAADFQPGSKRGLSTNDLPANVGVPAIDANVSVVLLEEAQVGGDVRAVQKTTADISLLQLAVAFGDPQYAKAITSCLRFVYFFTASFGDTPLSPLPEGKTVPASTLVTPTKLNAKSIVPSIGGSVRMRGAHPNGAPRWGPLWVSHWMDAADVYHGLINFELKKDNAPEGAQQYATLVATISGLTGIVGGFLTFKAQPNVSEEQATTKKLVADALAELSKQPPEVCCDQESAYTWLCNKFSSWKCEWFNGEDVAGQIRECGMPLQPDDAALKLQAAVDKMVSDIKYMAGVRALGTCLLHTAVQMWSVYNLIRSLQTKAGALLEDRRELAGLIELCDHASIEVCSAIHAAQRAVELAETVLANVGGVDPHDALYVVIEAQLKGEDARRVAVEQIARLDGMKVRLQSRSATLGELRTNLVAATLQSGVNGVVAFTQMRAALADGFIGLATANAALLVGSAVLAGLSIGSAVRAQKLIEIVAADLAVVNMCLETTREDEKALIVVGEQLKHFTLALKDKRAEYRAAAKAELENLRALVRAQSSK